jgi:pyruvate/2-oxoglutarate dehydrogenase complex dihydrolipoamide acyltransferase (E2) component
MTEVSSGHVSGKGIPAIPVPDFSVFGDIEIQPLSKINKLTGQHMSNVWLNLPMVTYHDEVDITEMEAFRVALNGEKIKRRMRSNLQACCLLSKHSQQHYNVFRGLMPRLPVMVKV